MNKLLLAVVLATGVVGCGGNVGRIRGQVVDNGQPVTIEGQAALMFGRIGADGKPDAAQTYPVPLSKDGSFELVASGGQVPPGTYLITLQVSGPRTKTGLGRYKGQSLRQEVAAGSNTLTIDLARFGS